jgi:UDP-hydrolysing UDP-N-acetyl-D-glucosamine 2-epimerase
LKICFFIGSRANYGRLKMVIEEAVMAGDIVDIILAAQGLKVDIKYKKYVRMKIDGLMFNDTLSNMVFTTGIIAEHVSQYFNEPGNRPNYAFVHGDRYECLGFAMAAAYNNVPLAHTEGGESTGSIDDKVRGAITSLADIHFTTTADAKDKLCNMYHVNPDKVFFVGSPAIDYLKSLDLTFPDKMPAFGLVIYHPNTTKFEDFNTFFKAIEELQNKIKLIWISPNVDPGNKEILKKIHSLDKVEFLKDISPETFYKYLYNCNFILGNTSAGIKEGGYLGIPYILVGERQHGRDSGLNIIAIDIDKEVIISKVMRLTETFTRYPRCTNKWGVGIASELIHRHLKELINK